jgi:hypothetical protein
MRRMTTMKAGISAVPALPGQSLIFKDQSRCVMLLKRREYSENLKKNQQTKKLPGNLLCIPDAVLPFRHGNLKPDAVTG